MDQREDLYEAGMLDRLTSRKVKQVEDGSLPNASLEAMKRDAARYRWLCNNNFDRDRMQIITYQQWTEPHSQTGEPQPWSARVRGGALDAIIDAEIAKEAL